MAMSAHICLLPPVTHRSPRKTPKRAPNAKLRAAIHCGFLEEPGVKSWSTTDVEPVWGCGEDILGEQQERLRPSLMMLAA